MSMLDLVCVGGPCAGMVYRVDTAMGDVFRLRAARTAFPAELPAKAEWDSAGDPARMSAGALHQQELALYYISGVVMTIGNNRANEPVRVAFLCHESLKPGEAIIQLLDHYAKPRTR